MDEQHERELHNAYLRGRSKGFENGKRDADKLEKRIKELKAKLKEFGNHKSNCAYIQGLKGQSIEKCDCGFE